MLLNLVMLLTAMVTTVSGELIARFEDHIYCSTRNFTRQWSVAVDIQLSHYAYEFDLCNSSSIRFNNSAVDLVSSQWQDGWTLRYSQNKTIRLPCSSVKSTLDVVYVSPSTVQFTENELFCQQTLQAKEDQDTPSRKSTWSFFDVFLVLLVLGVFLYLGLGILYKANQLGYSGTEAIPHIEFWRTVPGMVKDWIMSAVRWVSMKMGRSYAEEYIAI